MYIFYYNKKNLILKNIYYKYHMFNKIVSMIFAISIMVILGSTVSIYQKPITSFFVLKESKNIIPNSLFNLQTSVIDNSEKITKVQRNIKIDKEPIKSLDIEKNKKTEITYEQLLDKAKQLITKDYYTLATLDLNQAIVKKPEKIEAYLLLAQIYLQNNENTKVEYIIKDLKDKFPNRLEVKTIQVRSLITNQKYKDALVFLEKESKISTTLELYQGILYALQNNQKKALEIFQKLEKLPVSEVLNSKTITSIAQEQIKDFINLYSEFELLKDGKNPHLFALIAKILASHKENMLAKEFADIAIKEDIDYIDAWVIRGYSFLRMKYLSAALSDFRHAYELDPIRPEVQYFIAQILYEQQKHEEAKLFFEKTLEYDFAFKEEVQWKLIKIYSIQKKYEQVITLYRKVLQNSSESKEFEQAVHIALDLVKDPILALEFSEILYKKKPQDIFAINIKSWALIANNKLEEAETLLMQARVLYPNNTRTFLNLGLLEEKRQNFQSAKKFFEKCYYEGKKKIFISLANICREKHSMMLLKL